MRFFILLRVRSTLLFALIAVCFSSYCFGESTASKSVSILPEMEIPQLNRKRTVRLYLPPSYHSSKKRYPVLYMQDGQNLFDDKTSFSGEWAVDETLDALAKENRLEIIVVGIDNGGDKRIDEYSPWVHAEYGGGEADPYLVFIVKHLKPFIDSKYRTLPERENTGIMGSSMGALISHYAVFKHPEIFSRVAIYSPSYWFSNDIFEFTQNAQKGPTLPINIHFVVGDSEGYDIDKTMLMMAEFIVFNGLPRKNMLVDVVKGGKHNEAFWGSQFERSVLYLFGEKN